MGKPTVDVKEIMQPLFKKYAVNVDLLGSDKHRKDEVLKLRPVFNEKDGFNANNLMNWCKENNIKLSAITIAKWMDKGNSQVSPKPVKTTSASNAVNQWTNQLAGGSTEPQKHTITHAEWLWLKLARENLPASAVAMVAERVKEVMLEERTRGIEEQIARELAVLNVQPIENEDDFLYRVKDWIKGDEYKGNGMIKREDKKRLIDMAEAGHDSAKELWNAIQKDMEIATAKSNPFRGVKTEAEKAAEAEANEQSTDGGVSPSEASAA
ncbi:hypothetical protein BN1222_03579 [Klebsiella quasipneumoniae]|uniref:hypothetical protein n=1 Tax=Klebsiella quasipneumoniae TaxID=1463165 RepID=UPI0005DB44AD|nr:hypothetical protein [Klebsiella quasipneumoniae]CEL82317.1 hypothetical protein BN1222_03579 [Klebsiella quasipneumoniae]